MRFGKVEKETLKLNTKYIEEVEDLFILGI